MKNYLLACFLVVLAGATVFAQQRTVSGQITDSGTGEPIPGVNVLIQGTTSGTVTDIDGNYQLSVPSGEVTLLFSYVGYKTQAIQVGSQSTIDVQMESDVTALSEVVVVGYGTQEKKEITSAVSSVKAEEFNKGYVNNPAQLIQGKVPGLSVTRPGGDPNKGYDIRLRGLSSVGQNTSPLIVVDGVPGASLDNVDPNDIESIDVLKDGSSAAIYGTRGSAGVILVTTKTGKEGVFHIDYNGYATIEEPSKFVPVMNASEWRAFSDEVNAGVDYLNSTDWFKEITRTAFSHVHNLSMSGGTKQTSYRASLNVHDAQGIAITTGFKQLNGRLSLTQKAMDDKLTANLNFAGTYKKAEYGFNEAFRYATIYNPTAPVTVDENTPLPSGGLTVADYQNNWDGYYNLPGSFDYYNPVQILKQNINDGEDKRINLSGRLSYEIVPNLIADAFYSLQNDDFLRGRYYDKNSFWIGADQNGRAVRHNWNEFNQLFEGTFKWNGTVASNLSVSALAGYSYQDFFKEGFSIDGGNFLTDAFTYNNPAAAKYFQDGLGTINGEDANQVGKSSSKLIAFFGRINLNFNETYFLSASLRHEGSSKFGVNNKWGNFPAISGGVELANFIGSAAIDNLKVRASYGITGNLPNDSYLSLLRFGKQGNFLYNGDWIPTYGPVSNPAPNLKWEKKAEINFGVDYAFFGSRIFGSLEYYQRKTSDQIFEYAVPVPPNLYETKWTNLGELSNKGLELTFSYRAVDNPTFSYTPTVTASWYIENKILSLSNDEFEYGVRDLGDFGSPGQNQTPLVRVEEGKPIGQIWGLVYEGIDEDGNWKFKDVNGDGTASGGNEDRAVIGNGLPDYDVGFANTFTFGKNFDLNIFFRGTFGHDLVNQFRGFYEVPNVISSYNILKSSRDLKSPGGVYLGVNSGKFSSLHVEKGDFFKLDNFNLGYTVPLRDNSQIRRIRLYVAGNNTFIITGYKGVDPEVRWVDSSPDLGTFNNPLVPGIDRRNTWFRTRSWSLGVQIGF